MKFVILCASLLVLSCAAYKDGKLDSMWQEFKTTHGKTYPDAATEAMRQQLWLDNLKFVEAHNTRYEAGEVSYFMRQNRMSDLTDEERARFTNLRVTDEMVANLPIANISKGLLPDSKDWRKTGCVNIVKDQGQCGSCWAFSAIAALETEICIVKTELTSLSEQELVDCVPNTSCEDGGLTSWAFEFLETHGIENVGDYSYVAQKQACAYDSKKATYPKIQGYKSLTPGDEEALENAIADTGVISIAIDATKNFQFYAGGVFDDDTCGNQRSDLDHGVAAIGFGKSSDGKEFYIVRNSWSSSWGESGYIRMSRNKQNQCGIATLPTFPIV